MTDLRDALRDAVGGAPADHADLEALVDAGRRRVRRRRLVVATGAGVVALAVAVALTLPGQGRRVEPTPEPIRLDHARTVTPEVLSKTRATGDLAAMSGYAGLTADGLVLRSRHSPDGVLDRLGTLDVDSGRTTWLPPAPWDMSRASGLDFGAERLLFLAYPGGPTLQVISYDRLARTWERYTVHVGSARIHSLVMERAVLAPDGRIYLMAGSGETIEWWSLPTEAGQARQEPALSGRRVTWLGETRVTSELGGLVTLMAARGETVTIDGPPEGCETDPDPDNQWPPDLMAAGQRLVVTYACRAGARSVLYTASGRPLVDVDVPSQRIGVIGADDRFVLLGGDRHLDALDEAARELLEIGDRVHVFYYAAPRSAWTAGGLVLWTVAGPDETPDDLDVVFKVTSLTGSTP